MTDHAPPPLDPARNALFLDFDGTFVDFAPEPDAIVVRPGGRELLKTVARRLGGALALVTGRRIENLDGHLGAVGLPTAGLHGQQSRMAAGEAIELRPTSPQMEEARRRIADAIRPGDPIAVEDKGGALVLHYRRAPGEAPRARAIGARAVAGLADLHAQSGHDIVEVRQRGIGKAEAVRRFSEQPPFAGRIPVFVGDDTTDEDGFRAAAELGGFGVKIGPGETAARYRLADVSALHAWLAASACG
ncbi:trehalose-phosphatase [Propylenella binzhouense]|uniref:Trehalose 6-phosphate phosphatase n=1 Tax=Propylenella binzhouense TaxID=2555902 RepID=A0A964T4L5_9HYPH|nr:trehalose-phosphatase [Propylenella binzhouense]MYZ48285.1 trehalose-phosphatase [Propylenella binzhouense]